MESYSADRMSLQRQNMGTVSQKGQGVYSTLTQYVYSFEQKLLHFTFSWAGALEGVLLGSYKGARSLQPHFTSTEGFKDLLYGSRHKAERQHMSVTDLLKSWIPNFSSTKQRDVQRSASRSPILLSRIKGPFEVARPYSLLMRVHVNGVCFLKLFQECFDALRKLGSSVRCSPARCEVSLGLCFPVQLVDPSTDWRTTPRPTERW